MMGNEEFEEQQHSARLLLQSLKSNIVQSIRSYRISDLKALAKSLGHHFLYTNLEVSHYKHEVLEYICKDFYFPLHYSKNYDTLKSCLTEGLYRAGTQPGFVLVLDQIPAQGKFDKEARESLLDTFRDAAEYWDNYNIDFRCFYSFAVALELSATQENLDLVGTKVNNNFSSFPVMSSAFDTSVFEAS